MRAFKPLLSLISCIASLLFASQAALAGPQGGVIVGGTGAITSPNSTTTNIQQNTQSMAIDWQSFNVSSNEQVNFSQPSSTSVVLNNIHDQNPSQIFGAINANGRVFLANPNGIFFGAGSTVNVGALVAAGMNISDADFMAGKYRFGGDGQSGPVINHGLIQAATGGNVGLVGSSVSNDGVIIANYGKIELATGTEGVLNFDGDGLISIAVNGDVLKNSSGSKSNIVNSGTLAANGGQIILSSHAAENVFDQAINNSGMIQAKRMVNVGGKVELLGNNGTTISSGQIDASGAGGTGGTVHVLGKNVGLFNSATINASGTTGGGTVLIGGDMHGTNPAIQDASQAFISSDAIISANAGLVGNGGKVVVWSNDGTNFYGKISALGGFIAGNGGNAEVSGKSFLAYDGHVDLRALNGTTGTLLLDPENIDVVDSTFAGTTTTNLTATTACSSACDSIGYIVNTTIDTDLQTANVLLQATNTITVNAPIDPGISGTQGKSLTLETMSTNLSTLSSAFVLTSDTAAININANITTYGGNVILKTAYQGNNTGSFTGITTDGIAQAAGTTISTAGTSGTSTTGTINISTNGSDAVMSGALFSGVAAGSTAVNINNDSSYNTGNIILGGTSTYVGDTVISGGTLTLNASGAAGSTSGTITVGTNTLNINNNATIGNKVSIDSGGNIGNTTNNGTLTGAVTYSNNSSTGTIHLSSIGGAGLTVGDIKEGNKALTVDIAQGSVTLNGTTTGTGIYSGGTTITAGTSLQPASLTLSGAGSSSTPAGTGAITIGGTGNTLNIDSTSTTSAMSIANIVYVDDGGTISNTSNNGILTNTVTYNGTTNGGTINLSSSGAGLTVGAINDGTNTAAVNIVSGLVTLNGSGTYSGGTTVSDGTLTLDSSTTLGVITGTTQKVIKNGPAGTGSIDVGVPSTSTAVLSSNITPTLIVKGTSTTGVQLANDINVNTYTYTAVSGTCSTGCTSTGTMDLQYATVGDSNLYTGTTVTLDGGVIENTTGTGELLGAGVNANGGITLNNYATLNSSSAGGLTVNDVISDGGTGYGLTITGNAVGSVTLTGANTYTGNTTVSSGTLILSGTSSVASTSGPAGVSGTITVGTGATLDIQDGVTITNPVSLNGGTITNTADTFNSTASTNPGILNSNVTLGAVTSKLSSLSSGTNPAPGHGLTVNGIISEGGTGYGLTINSGTAGTVTLTGANTYTGNTTISGGTLTLSGTSSVASTSGPAGTGTITVSLGTVLDIQDGVTITNPVSLNGGTITNTADTFNSTASTNSGILNATVTLGAATSTLSSLSSGTNPAPGHGLTIEGNIQDSATLCSSGCGLTITDGTVSLTGTNNGAGGYDTTDITGGTLQIGNGGGSGTLGTGTVTDDSALVFDRTGSLVVANTISGTGTLEQKLGTIILTGGNFYSGATTIDSGAFLQVGNGGSSGSLNVCNTTTCNNIIDHGTLIFDLTGSVKVGNIITGAGGALEQKGGGTGTLILTGANGYAGTTTIDSGATLQVGDVGGTPSVDTGNLGTGSILDNGTLVFDLSSTGTGTSTGVSSISNAITGNGSLTVDGGGTVKLNGATGGATGLTGYSGGTTITNGTLSVYAAGAAGTNTINVGSNTLNIYSAGSGYTLANTEIDIGTGTMVVDNGCIVSSVVKINGGTVRNDAGTGELSGSVRLQATSTFSSTGNPTASGLTISGAIQEDVNTDTYGININTGTSGTVILAGANTYTGDTTVNGGTLKVTGTAGGYDATAYQYGTITVSSGTTLDISGGAVIYNPVTLNGGTITNGSGNGTLSSCSSAASPCAQPATGSAGTGTITLTADSVLSSDGAAGGLTINDVISGSGFGLDINGTQTTSTPTTGIVTLSGANTYTGATTIYDGTLAVDGLSATTPTVKIGNGTGNIYVGAYMSSYSGTPTPTLDIINNASIPNNVWVSTNTYFGSTTYSGNTVSDPSGSSSNITTKYTGTIANSPINASSVGKGSITGTVTLEGDADLISSANAGGLIIGGAIKEGTYTESGVTTTPAWSVYINRIGTTTGTTTGTVILTGTNNGTGGYSATNIAAGTLQIGNATNDVINGDSGTLGTGNVVDDGTLVFDRTGTFKVSNNIKKDSVATPPAGNLEQKGGGSGTLILTGTNTYTGTTKIDPNTTLQIGNGGSAGTLGSGNVIDDGTLVFDRNDTIIVANSISSDTGQTGNLEQKGGGSGTLILTSGTNTYTGTTTIDSATKLYVGNKVAVSGTTSVDTGSLGTGTVYDNGELHFDLSSTLTVGNLITGSGSLTQDGPGTLNLVSSTTSQNDYSGDTNINNGVLMVSGTNATLGTGLINVGNTSTAILIINDGANLQSNSGVVVVSGSTIGNTSGTGTLNLPANTNPKDYIKLNGTVTLCSLSDCPALSTTGPSSSTNLIIDAPMTDGTGPGSVVIEGNVTLGGANNYTGGTSFGSLPSGSTYTDTLTLSGTNAVLPGTTTFVIGSNTLIINDGANINTPVSISTGTIGNTSGAGTLSGSLTLNTASGTSANLSSQVNTTTSPAGLTISGEIKNGSGYVGNITKKGVGTVILAVDNTYTGTTTINAGTLQVGNGGPSGTLGQCAATPCSTTPQVIDGGTLAFDRSDVYVFSWDIVDNTANSTIGNVLQMGPIPGALILTGNNTYSGTTTINANSILEVGDATGTFTTMTNSGSLGGGTAAATNGPVVNNGYLIFNNAKYIDGTGAAVPIPITFGSSQLSGSGVLQLITGNAEFTGTNSGYSGSIQIDSGITLTVNGATASTGTGLIVVNPGSILDLIGGARLAGDTVSLAGGTITNSAGTGEVASPIQLINDSSLSSAGNPGGTPAGGLTISGNISSPNGLFNLAINPAPASLTGTVTLTGDNTYGDTTISSGTLSISTATAVGLGKIQIGAGTGSPVLQLDNISNLNNPIEIDNGTININSGSKIAFGGSMTLKGNATISTPSGSTFAMNGTVTHTVADTLTVNAGTSSVVNMANASNDFDAVSFPSGQNVTLLDKNDITLGAFKITGNLDVTSLNGIISDTGNVTVGGTTTLTANGATAANAGIHMSASGSKDSFAQLVTFNTTGDALITDTGTLNLGTSTAGNNMVLTGKAINFDSGGALTAGNLTLVGPVTSTGDLSLSASNAGHVNLSDTVGVTNGNLNITAGGLTINKAITVSGNVTIADTGNGINLGTSSSRLPTPLNITASEYSLISAGDIILSTQNGLTLSNDFVATAGSSKAPPTPLTINADSMNVIQPSSGAGITLTLLGNLDLGNTPVTSSGAGDFTVNVGGSFNMNGSITTNGKFNLTAANDITMGDPAVITSNSNDVNLTSTGGSVLLGLVDAGGQGVVNVTATAGTDANGNSVGGDILNNNGVFADVTKSKTNILAYKTTLTATNRIGASPIDAITLNINPSTSITMSFGAEYAYINDLNSTPVVDLSAGTVNIGLIFSSAIVGVGTSAGSQSTSTGVMNLASEGTPLPDEISILGENYQVSDEDEDNIVSTLDPIVPVMIKTEKGWLFEAPTRKDELKKIRENQRKGIRYIDWM